MPQTAHLCIIMYLSRRCVSGPSDVLAYKESPDNPTTTDFLWHDLASGIPANYQTAGSVFTFSDGGTSLASSRDYGVRVYIGPGIQ